MKPEFDATRSMPRAERSTVGEESADSTRTATPARGEPEVPADPHLVGNRYVLIHELARGGMGVVWRARDESIGRDVAIKILNERTRSSAESARRFLAESRITGRLQHPQIPAIHEIGKLSDGSPFLAMKLIEGQTLAHLIDSRTEPGRLLVIFEAVCQAVAFAHSRGVIHRDLKPGNVMVGAFGETQVMDWGVAKVIGEPEDQLLPEFGHEHAETKTGCVLGTPAYMPPEQARGEIDAIDRRSDVFGLGGILCSILTGQAPYLATTSKLVLRLAAEAKLDDTHERLRRCGADPALVDLARRCLAADPGDRPADACEVAAAVAKLRDDAEARARDAELARARLEVQTAEARKRRRAHLALAVTVVLAGVAAAVVVWDRQRKSEIANQERRDRSIRAEQTLLSGLDRVEGLLRDAHGEREDYHRRRLSVNAAKSEMSRLEALLDTEVPEAARSRYYDLQARWEEADRYAVLHQKLVELRHELNGKNDAPPAEARQLIEASRDLMRPFGFDPVSDDPRLVGERVKAHPLRDVVVAMWGEWRNYSTLEEREPVRRAMAAVLLDDTHFRKQWHEFVLRGRELELRKIADDPRALDLSAQEGMGLARDLEDFGSSEEARAYMKKLQVRHPGDYWINLRLSSMALFAHPRDDVEALNYAMAALGARPDSATGMINIATVYSLKQDYRTAVTWSRRAFETAPENARVVEKHASLLWATGDNRGARELYQKALTLAPRQRMALLNFATYSANAGDYATSLDIILRYHAESRGTTDFERHVQYVAVRLGRTPAEQVAKLESLLKSDPESVGLNYLYARLLAEAGRGRDALDVLDRLRDPQPPGPFLVARGVAHARTPGGQAKAREYLTAVMGLATGDADAARELGLLLADDPATRKEAIAHLKTAAAGESDVGRAKLALIRLYLAEKQADEALDLCRRWVKAADPRALDVTVNELMKAREFDAAVKLVESAAEGAKPPAGLWDHARKLHTYRGDFRTARDAAVKHRDSVRADPNSPDQVRREAEQAVTNLDRWIPDDDQLKEYLAGKLTPADAAGYIKLARHCYFARYHYKLAVELFERGFALKPAMLDPTNFVSERAYCVESIMFWLSDQAKDAPPPADPADRARLRDRALELMTVEVRHYDSRIATAKKPFRTVLATWEDKAHFASVRGDAIDKLPAREREPWRKLWAEHRRVNDALLGKDDP